MTITSETPESPTRKQKIIVALIVIGAVIVIFSLLKASKPEPPAPNLQEQLTRVNTARLTLSTASPSFKTIGRITASAMSEMKSQVAGTVLTVNIETGQKVTKGDVLLEIDPTEQNRSLLQAQAQFILAKSNLEQAQAQHTANLKLLSKDNQLSALATRSLKRYQDLLKRNLATEAQVDQANEIAQRQASSTIQRQTTVDNWPSQLALLEAQLEASEASFMQAQEDLASTKLIAPFDGTVATVMVAPAGRVSKGMSLLSLYDHNRLILEASIPESAMQSVMANTTQNAEIPTSDIFATGKIWGQSVKFRLKAFAQNQGSGGGTLGNFTPIDKASLPVNRALETTIYLPQSQKAYDIPVIALHDHQYIYRLNDENQLQRQDVILLGETYIQDERRYLIAAANIPENSMYVTSQMTKNVNGMQVEPADTTPKIKSSAI